MHTEALVFSKHIRIVTATITLKPRMKFSDIVLFLFYKTRKHKHVRSFVYKYSKLTAHLFFVVVQYFASTFFVRF